MVSEEQAINLFNKHYASLIDLLRVLNEHDLLSNVTNLKLLADFYEKQLMKVSPEQVLLANHLAKSMNGSLEKLLVNNSLIVGKTNK